MNIANLDCSYEEFDDYQLVLACQQKIEAAFNELYKRYVGHVRGTLRRLAPDLVQSHEDIVQEVFMRVWKSLDKLRNPRAFRKWLNRLIMNLFYNELRKRQNVVVLSTDVCQNFLENGDNGASIELADNSARPDEVCERNESIVHINEALRRLPAPFKRVFVLREYYGLAYEEIAIRTNTELGTVKSRISRAKCKMQLMLPPLNCA